MKCTGISIVKNEADIIEIFIRHNLKHLDALHIIDHNSQDNTLEILNLLKKEGYNLEISTNLSARNVQAEVFNKLLKNVHTDFVTFIDADEFLVGSFQDLPDDTVSFINWHNYLPHISDDKNEINVLKRIKHTLSPPDTNQHKALIPYSIYKNPTSFVPQGGHEIYFGDYTTPAPYQLISSVHLAHFPARNLNQIKNKVFVHWICKLANPLHQSGKLVDGKIPTYHHLKVLFDTFKNDLSITEEEAMNAVRKVYTKHSKIEQQLVCDPVPNDDIIKYEIKNLEPLTILADAAEQQAVALQKTNQIILGLKKDIEALGDL